jgi:ABC-type amino acid transport substrate-binding protein
MKTKKMAVTVLMVFGLLAALSLSAHAATFTCTVVSAGPLNTAVDSGTRFFLTEASDDTPEWSNKQFQVGATRAKEYLAVALTAISQGKKVKITTPNTGTVPFITSMYLQSQ